MKKSMRVVAICFLSVLMMFAFAGCGSEEADIPVKVEGESIFIDHSKTIGDYIMMIPSYGDTYRNDNFSYTLLHGEQNFGWITAVDFGDKNWLEKYDENIIKLLQNDSSKLEFVEQGSLQYVSNWYVYSIADKASDQIVGYYIVFGNTDSQYAYVMCMDASYTNIYGYNNMIYTCVFNESSFEEYAYKNIEYHINQYKEGLEQAFLFRHTTIRKRQV